jgi:hypothetical protein
MQGLLYFQTKGTCLSIAMALGMSHDRFNQLLKKNWSGQERLGLFSHLENLKGNYLIIDDTAIEKPHSKSLKGLHYVYSGSLGKTAWGYCIVIMIWTDGHIRIPISMRMWKPGGKTKIELAMEMLSYARNQLNIKPDYVLFDSWYAAKSLLKRIRDYGWYFVTRLKENRKLNGVQLRRVGWRQHFQGHGKIQGGIKVHVVKNGDKYLASNKLSLSREEMENIYLNRSQIEEVNKVLKQECNLKSCQIDSIEAQEHHFWCSLCAFAVLERESKSLGVSIYELRSRLSHRGSSLSLPLFERIRECA